MSKIFRISSVTVIAISILMVLFNYWQLGEEIPVHFNAKGEADDYGSKITIWIILTLEIGVFLLIDYFSKRPEIGNSLVKITAKNKKVQYQLITGFLLQTNLLCSLLFLIILNQIFKPIVPNYYIHVVVGLMLLCVVVYLVKSYQNK